jgi:hypothetical protein
MLKIVFLILFVCFTYELKAAVPCRDAFNSSLFRPTDNCDAIPLCGVDSSTRAVYYGCKLQSGIILLSMSEDKCSNHGGEALKTKAVYKACKVNRKRGARLDEEVQIEKINLSECNSICKKIESNFQSNNPVDPHK